MVVSGFGIGRGLVFLGFVCMYLSFDSGIV